MLAKLVKWGLILIGLLAVVGAIVAAVPGVSAQESPNATEGEHLNPDLVVTEYGYDGQGYVTLHADSRQEVTVYDPTGVFTDGPTTKREVVLPPDTTRTISIDLGVFKGTRAIAVQYDGDTWGEPVEQDRTWVESWGAADVALAVVISVAVTLGLVFGLRWLFDRFLGEHTGRIA